jgi:hypothetical protein
MVSDADLLQANATIITGVLIFLTIAPFSRGTVAQIIGRKAVLGVVLAILVVLTGSVVIMLFSSSSLFEAKIFFVIGIGLIGFTMFLILLALPTIGKEQKRLDEYQDEHQ